MAQNYIIMEIFYIGDSRYALCRESAVSSVSAGGKKLKWCKMQLIDLNKKK